MKKLAKQFTMTALTASLLIGSAVPAFAKSYDEFDVDLSSYETEDTTSIEFQFDIEDDDYYLVEGKEIKVTFPSGFIIPKRIDEEDVSINGEEPDDIKVSGSTITLIVPEDVDGDDEIEIEFDESIGIKNPKKAGDDYFLKVTPYLETITKDSRGKEVKKYIRPVYESDYIEIEQAPPPKPVYKPKTLEVVVSIGSLVGSQRTSFDGKDSAKMMTLESAPYTRNGSTLVPVRFIAEGLGVEVMYDKASRSAGMYLNGQFTQLTVGNRNAMIGSRSVTLPVAPEVVNGRMMIPLRFVAENMGAEVEWLAQSQTIIVKKTTQETVAVK